MTTEDDFHRRLDECPDDFQTRLIFADWLQEHDDVRAEGYRTLGVLRVRPKWCELRPYLRADESGRRSLAVWLYTTSYHTPISCPRYADARSVIPSRWGDRTACHVTEVPEFERNSRHGIWIGYTATRRALEDAAARAFADLDVSDRADLARQEPNP